MNSAVFFHVSRLTLFLCFFIFLSACQSGSSSKTGIYRLDDSGDSTQLKIENFGFYGVTLPLNDGDRSSPDHVVLSASYREYLASWVENLRGGEGTDYHYYEPVYLRAEEGFDFAIIPGEMKWLRRDRTGQSDAVRESLELKQSRMRVQETFASTPKDQLVRFLRFGVFRFEKSWFAQNGWDYGAEEGAGRHVYIYASNPEGSERAAEQRIILGLNNEFLILVGASDGRDRAAMRQAIDRVLNDLSFHKEK